MSFCSNCGKQMENGANFCSNCGATTGFSDYATNSQHTNNNGEVHRCPQCGGMLDSFIIKCPYCGNELRDEKNSSSVREFVAKLEAIEAGREQKRSNPLKNLYFGEPLTKTDEQKISLIRSFVIPNTKEDLYEFLILSVSNIDIDSYEEDNQIKNEARRAISDAWKAKFEQAYQKAKLLFADDLEFQEIEKLYNSTNESIKKAKWKTWKLIGILFGVLFVIGIVLFVLLSSQSTNSDEKEVEILEEKVSQIEEVAENSVTLEAPLDKSDEDTTNNSSKEEIIDTSEFSKNNNKIKLTDEVTATSNKYIEIKKVDHLFDGDYLKCVVTITNPSTQNVIEYPTYRVTAYGKDNKVLGSEEQVLNMIYPKQDFIDNGIVLEVSEKPHRIEVIALEPDDYNIVSTSKVEHPIHKQMIGKNISVNSSKITGEIYNPNDYNVDSAKITVVFRDTKGNLVSSEMTFVDQIPANGTIPFEIMLNSDIKATDKVEVFAYIW